MSQDQTVPGEPSEPAGLPGTPDQVGKDQPSGWRQRLKASRIGRIFKRAPVVAAVPLNGVIGRLGGLRQGLSISTVAPLLERAFTLPHVKCVALLINSPGGSPVQSALIGTRIRALADQHEVPVVAFCEDVAASGGYWLACAADEIFVDQSSIVGSIGVISSGFGFNELIGRYGIERRVYTAGNNKSILDPFKPEDADDVARLKDLQNELHANFIGLVKERRGDRLNGPDAELFDGSFWTGRRALELGLVDGIGDVRAEMRARYGEKVRLKLVQAQKRFPFMGSQGGVDGGLARNVAGLLGGASGGSRETVEAVMGAVEERLLWSRYGL